MSGQTRAETAWRTAWSCRSGCWRRATRDARSLFCGRKQILSVVKGVGKAARASRGRRLATATRGRSDGGRWWQCEKRGRADGTGQRSTTKRKGWKWTPSIIQARAKEPEHTRQLPPCFLPAFLSSCFFQEVEGPSIAGWGSEHTDGTHIGDQNKAAFCYPPTCPTPLRLHIPSCKCHRSIRQLPQSASARS